MGGEHKCPLCPATFTRPQHVGRHLRAHTGDRPYECKECPLKFARSDLLSRHVNKTHKEPDSNDPTTKKETKRGRRKSMPGPVKTEPKETLAEKARRASYAESQNPHRHPLPQPLQAQSMYPHHPLLSNTPLQSSSSWQSEFSPVSTGNSLNGMLSGSLPPPRFPPEYPSMPGQTGLQSGALPQMYSGTPMRMTGSDQTVGSSSMGRGWSGGVFDYGLKKRACDQCNHSKVRCDCAEPCARCRNKNISCSYNKPQRARTVTTIPSQYLAETMVTSGSGSSYTSSPPSHYSSPHSNPAMSPLAPNTQVSGQQQRRSASMSEYAVHRSGRVPLPTHAATWNSIYSQPAQYPSPRFTPPSHLFDSALSSISSHSAVSQGPTMYLQQPMPGPSASPYKASAPPANDLTASPFQNLLTPTPALTSHSTSPSSSEELASERRTSSTSLSSKNPQVWYDPGSGSGSVESGIAFPDTAFVPDGYSPRTASVKPQEPMMSPYAWPSTASSIVTVDPRQQFRSSISSEDDANASDYGYGAPQYIDMNEQALQDRRRSSVASASGVWATAFTQMTLQDHAAAAAEAGVDMNDPYMAAHIAHSVLQNRPTLPALQGLNGEGKIPSLNDVKDLWKMFMSDNMNGMTPAPERDIDPLETVPAPLATPRPRLGTRSLSKSSSMPDLTSPSLLPQQFNLGTPRALEPQGSYTPQARHVEPNDGDSGRWKRQIQQRQPNFTLDPGGRIGKSANRFTIDPDPEAGGYFGRPIPSVLQQSSALQQTLAPARTPSFGLHSAESPISYPAHHIHPRQAMKMPPHIARPGNKRLASQTLVPELQKAQKGGNSSLEPWDETNAVGSQQQPNQNSAKISHDTFTMPPRLMTGVTGYCGGTQSAGVAESGSGGWGTYNGGVDDVTKA